MQLFSFKEYTNMDLRGSKKHSNNISNKYKKQWTLDQVLLTDIFKCI